MWGRLALVRERLALVGGTFGASGEMLLSDFWCYGGTFGANWGTSGASGAVVGKFVASGGTFGASGKEPISYL